MTITELPPKISNLDYIKQVISPHVQILRSGKIVIPCPSRGDLSDAREKFGELLASAPKGVTLEIRARLVDYARSIELGWYTSSSIEKLDPEEVDDLYKMPDTPYYYCGRVRLT